MKQGGGWTVGRSIAVELGLVMHGMNGRLPLSELPEALAHLVHELPEDWLAERSRLLAPSDDVLPILLVTAWLTDGLYADDYSAVTRAMRQLDMPTALARMTERAATVGITPDESRPPEARFAWLWHDMQTSEYDATTLPELIDRPGSVNSTLLRLSHFLQGGDLHSQFWHWLDRFYYETYASWRAGCAETMDRLEQSARMRLGDREAQDRPPTLDWLPAQNPLANLPTLRQAVEVGRYHVFFLVEPMGLSDILLLAPGTLISAFAEPGAIYTQYNAFALDLAQRLKAVADPTRLKILRLMRHLELDNTQIAAFLEIARPTVSIHARQLREAGLIETRREGRKARHMVRSDAVRALFEDLERFLDLRED